MKTITVKAILLYLFLSTLIVCASDSPSFDGDWSGTLKLATEKFPNLTNEIAFRIVIKGDSATQYIRKNGQWIASDPNTRKYSISRMHDICVVEWLKYNPNDVWTEHQTYSLSYIGPSKLNVVFMRHVTNRDEGKEGEPWFYVFEGELTQSELKP